MDTITVFAATTTRRKIALCVFFCALGSVVWIATLLSAALSRRGCP